MKKQLLLVCALACSISDASIDEKSTRLGILIDNGKKFLETIVDGAYETWDDCKEVYDEVSADFADKVHENYQAVVNKIGVFSFVQKYFH